MNIQQLKEEWAKDSPLKMTDLANESMRIPLLHSKYLGHFSDVRLKLRSKSFDMASLMKKKHEYYNGVMSKEDLDANGWEPIQRIILKGDIPIHIDSDEDIIKLRMEIAVLEEKIKLYDEIVKHINARNFIVKNAIDYLRWTNGG